MSQRWYDDGYAIGYALMAIVSCLLAALFFFRPNWAKRIWPWYSDRRIRLQGYGSLIGAMMFAGGWIAHVTSGWIAHVPWISN